jgi:hypothetical protein
MRRTATPFSLVLVLISPAVAAEAPPVIRSAGDGRWSEPATWAGGQVPGAGARVQVRAGHVVTYDVARDEPIRSIHVGGTLRFDPDRDTWLVVGLIKIQTGDDPGESGFDCEEHVTAPAPGATRAALEVGRPDRPIPAGRRAVIRLAAAPGLDPRECPAIVCCGGRMEIHGAEMPRTWVKLAATAAGGSTTINLDRPVPGWRSGDRVIVTATRAELVRGTDDPPSVRDRHETEERTVRRIDGLRLELDAPLEYEHAATGAYRGEVALLSRNVVVESADPDGVRGHTMYHRHSAGSISYAEFRHLGKAGELGKYSLHFHRVGDTMRGTSVIGASIWDSGNRWITIHGTNGLVVRDCVGYGSVGHGFFLEDGSEVDNVLDGNLAVRAWRGRPLPGQALAFDRNEGAGFWWANSRNAFIRNVAVECDRYGFRYEAPAEPGFDPRMRVRGPDGSVRPVDIRTLPFTRFEDNEAHAQSGYGLDLGGGPGDGEAGGVGGVGPDARHPFVVRGLRVWAARWAVMLDAPSVVIDGLDVAHCQFGLWRPRPERHAYRNMNFYHTGWRAYLVRGELPSEGSYPGPLDPVDDRPPFTVVTRVEHAGAGRLLVRGTSIDDGAVRSVRLNGRAARPVIADYSQWEAEVEAGPDGSGADSIVAEAVDAAGHVEPVPHRIAVPPEPGASRGRGR